MHLKATCNRCKENEKKCHIVKAPFRHAASTRPSANECSVPCLLTLCKWSRLDGDDAATRSSRCCCAVAGRWPLLLVVR
uniref:Uncharacterized protein n=1 Tax=Anopheles coluzzii TaxID=1518534 RepID=A0A8W7PPS5_ANOCL